jgi:pimeloyl-ACP methyl ester carboxylesterase
MELVHERRGSGQPLLLLHGIGHRWQAWEPVLDELAQYHDVIAVDLPGFGASPVPPSGPPKDMAELTALIVSFLDGIGVRCPHVAGNSLGGAIALELAAAGAVSTATALSPAGFYRNWEMSWGLGILRSLRAVAHLPTPLLRLAANTTPMRAAAFAAIAAHPTRLTPEAAFGDTLALRNAPAFRSVAKAGATYKYRGHPEVPVTVAWGDKDRILFPRQADRAALQLPKARHIPLPDCGHVPMSDAPELIASVILATTGAKSAAAA